MSDAPINLLMERVNRQTMAIRDSMDSQAAQGRLLIAAFDGLRKQVMGLEREMAAMRSDIATVRADLLDLRSEVVLLGRTENAFSRALGAHVRLDEAGVPDDSRLPS